MLSLPANALLLHLAGQPVWDVSLAHESIRVIERAAQRAADLTTQMLAYAGKAELTIALVDLNALITEVAHLLRVSMGKTVTLNTHLALHLPSIAGDTTQIRQVVMNLIVNATEAIGDVDGVIILSTGVQHVDPADLSTAYFARDLPAGDYVYLEVADTGCGMDLETQERIFDPFFTTKTPGRGLGLAAVLGDRVRPLWHAESSEPARLRHDCHSPVSARDR